MVKVGQTCRRLDAGEASRGGEPWVCVSGDKTVGRGHLKGAGAHPHPARHVAAAGTAEARRKRARGGAGTRVSAVMQMQWPWRRMCDPYGGYAGQRVCWTRRLDQMVAGVVSAASAGGGAVGRGGVAATECKREKGEGED